jgi:hypothetical protein
MPRLGQFDIYIDKNDNSLKEYAVNKIKQIALNNSLSIDVTKTNEDTLSFFGPPYHYIQFFFDNKTIQDSIIVKIVYTGRLATSKSTDKIYYNLINQIDSVYKDRIKYNLLEKR